MIHLHCAKGRRLPALVCCTLFFMGMVLEMASAEGITLRHGPREEKNIAVTVDDCYNTHNLREIVSLCEAYCLPMTFFPTGNTLKYADGPLWQRILDAGCEIGNHSWGHKNLTGLSRRQIEFQMLRTQQKLDEMLGYHYPMQVMRPPYGKTNKRVAETVSSVGYLRVVKWDIDSTEPEKVLNKVQNGSILLFHANGADVRCLKKIIPRLTEQGYTFVTVSELLGLDAVEPSEEIYRYDSGKETGE